MNSFPLDVVSKVSLKLIILERRRFSLLEIPLLPLQMLQQKQSLQIRAVEGI